MDCCAAMATILTKQIKDSSKSDHKTNVVGTSKIRKSGSSSRGRRMCKNCARNHSGKCCAPPVCFHCQQIRHIRKDCPSLVEVEKDMARENAKDAKL